LSRAQSSHNDPECVSATTAEWAKKCGIRIDFIQLGNPQQNAYVERYNRTVRYDWLAHHLFETVDETVKVFPAENIS
jgi:putative transposase